MPKIRLNPNEFKKSLEKKKRNTFHIETGNNLEILKRLNPNQFDAMVTDPPAGISFMGKDWDGDKGSRDEWIRWLAITMAECMRVLKPGAHALVWCIPRTQHWTMMALENAGFIVRDVVYHFYGQGFPKSHDISKAIDKAAGAEREVIGQYKSPEAPVRKGTTSSSSNYRPEQTEIRLADAIITAPATPEAQKWSGWGTALKPACEPWILVQKPLSENTIAANVLKHGTGGLNIDGTRIAGDLEQRVRFNGGDRKETNVGDFGVNASVFAAEPNTLGRFPANVIFDPEAAEVLDEQSGILKSGNLLPGHKRGNGTGNSLTGGGGTVTGTYGGDSGGASRFFYVAKASKSDRGAENIHPTVKPISLMKHLIKLITPPGGTVLDPFMGSGTTGVAAIKNGFKFFGIDQDKQYSEIALKRLLAVYRMDVNSIKTVKAKN